MKRSFLMLILAVVCGVCGCGENSAEDVNASIKGNLSEEIRLPCKYSYIEEKCVPKIRNQGSGNTCWAYASMTALESSKDVHESDAYSVEHLIEKNPFRSTFEDGGSYMIPMSYLVSWTGPIIEGTDVSETRTEEDLQADLHVQEIRMSEPRDFETIKRFIYLYGGVESALYLDFGESVQESLCYNEETFSYCYKGNQKINHDVVLIGWDDAYPAENFSGEVSGDGAFICQNSWGDKFGNQGIFYVSYEDVNIGKHGIVYSRVDAKDNYDLIYQTDLCGYTANIGYQAEDCWFANVYTAELPVLLQAAGFYATGKNTSYEIYVVQEFGGKDSFGEKEFMCSGFLEDAGYYTIDFPEPVKADACKDFAMIVHITTENAEFPVAVECPVEGFAEYVNLSDGEGYLSHQGITWEHVEETKNYNICLKTYADLQ